MPRKIKTLPGLHQRNDGYWQVDKKILNYGRLNRSTNTKDYQEAERRARRWIQEKEDAAIHGKRTRITFEQAAILYLEKEKEKPIAERKKSIDCDINDINKVLPYIGHLYLDQIYDETITPYKTAERKSGKKGTTINRSIRTVSHILKLCAVSWRDEHHRPYLDTPPLLQQVDESDKESTKPIEYSEERALLAELNEEYRDYWTFAVNTGVREKTQTKLKWEYEVAMPSLNTTAFLIPRRVNQIKNTKNDKDFLLVLNRVAKEIIERYRGKDTIYVFPSPKGGHYSKLNGKHFRNARKRAKLTGLIKWHSARATFATRLRATRVSHEDRQQLLGHSGKSITTQYSWADINHLIECVDKLCTTTDTSDHQKMDLTSLFRIER